VSDENFSFDVFTATVPKQAQYLTFVKFKCTAQH